MADMTLPMMLDVLRASGLPEPLQEHRFARPRKWQFDYCWPDLKVAFEFEGGTWTNGAHVRGKHYASDCEKYSEAAIDGWKVIRATTDMVRSGKALDLLERALLGASAGD